MLFILVWLSATRWVMRRQTKIPSIVSPPDGDSVISVGAVDSTGRIAYFSSNGPTSDGRMKPDVVAMGVNVICGGYIFRYRK